MGYEVNSQWVEVSCPEPGHQNFVFRPLEKRYAEKDGKYVLVMHEENKNCHFIVGLFHSLKDCLAARCYANFGVVMMDAKMSKRTFAQAHKITGEIIDHMIYDPASELIREK